MGKYFYRADRTLLRRELRKNMTVAERCFWSYVQGRRFEGWQFRRQASIGRYVVDFYCPALKLVVEIDGDTHAEELAVEYDQIRTTYLEAFGLRVLRFENTEVLHAPKHIFTTLKSYSPS